MTEWQDLNIEPSLAPAVWKDDRRLSGKDPTRPAEVARFTVVVFTTNAGNAFCLN
jgi:hypothetical protein